MQYIMDTSEILQCLPHRYPFLLIDKVLEMDVVERQSIVALKNVTINEPFFTGHFPRQPIMPGVLILEAMAQAAAILGYQLTNMQSSDGVLFYFAGIDHARFRRVVVPGDQLRLEVNVIRRKRDVWKLAGAAYVGEEVACTAELLTTGKSG
jgi:3-hydroxyacyl-[acyl-carrier-protein] dehydratase